MEKITSTKNPKIKFLISLQESKGRKDNAMFLIEGKREIEKAVQNGFHLQYLFFCSEISGDNSSDFVSFLSASTLVFETSRNIFDKIAYRENRDGIIAVAGIKNLFLDEIKLSANPLILVLESVEKPGNLGAILRTADAAGIDAIIVCDPKTDLYNPNIIRSSLGCIFTKQVVSCSSEEALQWLKKNNIKIFSAAITPDAVNCYSCDFTQASAIVLGSEAWGLSEIWLKESNQNIIIPMFGQIDSMNVSVSCAVLAFEAVRQRQIF